MAGACDPNYQTMANVKSCFNGGGGGGGRQQTVAMAGTSDPNYQVNRHEEFLGG